jgi:hypothetical protein
VTRGVRISGERNADTETGLCPCKFRRDCQFVTFFGLVEVARRMKLKGR